MIKRVFFVVMVLMFFSFVTIMPHGDEKHKEKPEKVSSGMQMDMGDKQAHPDSLGQAEQNTAEEKDFAQIRDDVQKSTVPTVIKAVSLAALIAGLAFLYLPKKKKIENPGDRRKENLNA